MALRVSYDHAGLDPAVVQALDSIIAQVQTWANSGGQADQVVGRDLTVGRVFTATNQPALRMTLSSTTIADSTETPIKWTPPTGDPQHWYDYNVGSAIDFDGTNTVYLAKTGLYIVNAWVRWDTGTTGERLLQYRIAGDDTENYDNVPASAQAPVTSSTVFVRVTPDILKAETALVTTPRGVPVIVEGFHTQGSDVTLTHGILQIAKVA